MNKINNFFFTSKNNTKTKEEVALIFHLFQNGILTQNKNCYKAKTKSNIEK